MCIRDQIHSLRGMFHLLWTHDNSYNLCSYSSSYRTYKDKYIM